MTAQDQQDTHFMARAFYLARKGLYTTKPNPRVGCVLVKDGRIIGEGWHQYAGQAHAELEAINNATEDTKGSTAYVTLEPCSHYGKTPPCCEALIKAGINRVVAAMQDPNPLVSGNGFKLLEQAGIAVTTGVLEPDARELNRGFIKRMTEGRPFIRSKLAMSLDGRTAMASGESQWITSQESRADVQKLRAESSAILTGINTVLKDDPSLTARVGQEVVQPIRVVLDSNLQMPVDAKMAKLSGRTIVLTCCPKQVEPFVLSLSKYERNNINNVSAGSFDYAQESPVEARTTKYNQLLQSGFEVYELPANNGRIDLPSVITFLVQQQINEVLVEAGAVLNGALLQANLINEWIIYMAPKILGDQGRGLFHLPGLVKLADCNEMKFRDTQRIGSDLKIMLLNSQLKPC